MIRRAQGLLFDFGGTLMIEEAFDHRAGTERVLGLARNPRGLSAERVCELVGELERDLGPRREASWLEYSPFMVHRLVYEPNGIRFERSLEEIELEFWRAATRFTPTDGIAALLETLRGADLPLGVVSNAAFTSSVLCWQLTEAGLQHFFEFVMASGDYGIRKPHPTLFQAAARKLGSEPEHTWFIGDSPAYDVAGAAKAGMVSVLYGARAPDAAGIRPDLCVGAWTELPGLLADARTATSPVGE